MQVVDEVFLRDRQGQCDSQSEAPRFSKLFCCHVKTAMLAQERLHARKALALETPASCARARAMLVCVPEGCSGESPSQ